MGLNPNPLLWSQHGRLTDEELLAMPVPERIRALLLEALQRGLNADPVPDSIAVACYNIRSRTGLSKREFATRLQAHQSTISRVESSSGKGTPNLLVALAEEAAREGLNNTAQYLRMESRLLEAEIRRRGGKR